jgi:hypothetical protein
MNLLYIALYSYIGIQIPPLQKDWRYTARYTSV